MSRVQERYSHFQINRYRVDRVQKNIVIPTTVKRGYNDHGYNKFTAIINKGNSTSEMVTLLHKRSQLKLSHSHNEQIFVVPYSSL